MSDIVERLRSRAEAPNAWTRADYFLLEVADEIERLRNRCKGQQLVIVEYQRELNAIRGEDET